MTNQKKKLGNTTHIDITIVCLTEAINFILYFNAAYS